MEKLPKILEARVLFTAFDSADIGPVDVCGEPQLLLRESASLTEFTKYLT